MARNSLATDTFTRSDSSDLGADWDGGYTSYDEGRIESNLMKVDAVTNFQGLETYGTTTPGDDQYASIFVSRMSNAFAYVNSGAVCRASAPATASFYSCQIQHDDIFIGKTISGVFTLLSSVAHLINTNVTEDISLECVGTGLTGFANLVSLVSTSDSDLTSGRTGICWYIDSGGTNNDIHLDNFEMGDFGGGGGGGSTSHNLLL